MEKRLATMLLMCTGLIFTSFYFFIQANALEKEVAEKSNALEKAISSVNIPIGMEKAKEIARSDPKFLEFSNKYFRDPSLRIELASLEFHEDLGYVWNVEIIERKCGCGGTTTLNSINMYINPETGDVVKIEKHIGLKEGEYAKKNCNGCHE